MSTWGDPKAVADLEVELVGTPLDIDIDIDIDALVRGTHSSNPGEVHSQAMPSLSPSSLLA